MMTVSENTGGSQTAVITTEHTLATISAAGTYQLVVELTNMANNDVLELRIKIKGRSASTSRVVFFATYAHAQGANTAVAISPPVPAPFEFVATLTQTAGTGRAFIWSIYEY
jgi:hypothetical protein